MEREDIKTSWLVNTYIAHRGLHNDIYPENSLSAFGNAIKNNYAIELDVHQISDGTVIVFHDNSTSRMTSSDKYVANLTKSDLEELRLLNTEEKIPTLEEVLNFVSGQVPILIEIKNTLKAGDLEKAVYKLLKNYNGEYAVQSFNPYVLEWFKKNAPDVIRGQLSSFFKGEKMPCFRKYVLKRMKLNKLTKPDFISYNAEDLPNRFCKKYKDTPILAWVVKSQSQYNKLLKNVDNIIFEDFTPTV